MVEDVEQTAITIRDAIKHLPERYENNQKEINQLEKERTDLLHMAELVDLNAVDGFRLYKEIQRVERDRRERKDENELLKNLYPTLKG